MSLKEKVSKQIITAMKAKDQTSLRALRAIKAAVLLLDSQEGGKEITEQDELTLLAKLAKQRKDSLTIYEEQNREDLAIKEKEELAIIETFLPKQMDENEIKVFITEIIKQTGASSMKDMGKVMGIASGKLKGKADGKIIANLVKSLLS